MKWIVQLGFLSLFFAFLLPSALAWDIQGPDEIKARLYKAQETYLEPCEARAIEKAGLEHVIIPPHPLPTVINPITHEGFHPEAVSMLGAHLIVINTDVWERVYIHELGHWRDKSLGFISNRADFQEALAQDENAMNPLLLMKQNYLMNPHEAWAELFAYLKMGSKYYEGSGAYMVNLWPKTAQAELKLEACQS